MKELTKEATEKMLINFVEKMKIDNVNNIGYIFMPKINGFDIFEIPKDRLEDYIMAERIHLNSVNAEKAGEKLRDKLISNKKEVCEFLGTNKCLKGCMDDSCYQHPSNQ